MKIHYGRLSIEKEIESVKGRRRFICICKCGKKGVKWLSHLVHGKSKSCGCLSKEMKIKRNTTHGLTKTREFEVWMNMKERCSNPKHNRYKYYGGKGIKVCDRWKESFLNFLSDMGKRPIGKVRYTIERINGEKGYGPSNCKWATYAEQNKNRKFH